MSNIRKTWQQDVSDHWAQSAFMATVTATPGSGTVTFKRYPAASAETQPYISSYTNPQVGDYVMVMRVGTGWLVMGTLTAEPTPTVPLATNSFITSDIALSANAAANITSLTLGAGQWLLLGTIVYTTTGTFYAWLGTVSASTSGLFAEVHSQVSGGNPATISVANYRVGPGTYYLNAQASAAATVKATGGVTTGANGLITNLQAIPV